MIDFRTIYIICTDKKNKEFSHFQNLISTDLYDRIIIEDYSYFSQTILPEFRSILFFEVTPESLEHIENFDKQIGSNLETMMFFMVAQENREIFQRITELKHYGVIFKPYVNYIIDYLLMKAKKQREKEQLENEKRDNFAKQNKENENKLRELDSIFKIYHLVDKERDINTMLGKALPIITRAFSSNVKMSIRITFMERVFLSDDFEESTRKISDSLIKQDDFKGNIEIFINDETLEKFPFTLEEINTFSTIRSLLTKALEGIIFEEMGRLNFEYSMFIYSLFKNYTNGQYIDSKAIFLDTIVKIENLFFPQFCFIADFDDINLENYKIYKSFVSKNENIGEKERKILKKIIPGLDEKSKKPLFFKSSTSRFIVIPYHRNKILKGIMVLSFNKKDDITIFFQNSLFGMISEFLSLTMDSQEYLDSIKIYKQAFEYSPASIVITDIRGSINYVNPHFESVTGYTSDEVLGKNPRVLKSGLQDKSFYSDMWSTISSGKQWHGNLQNFKKDGSLFWESASISPIINNGKIFAYIAIKEDITKKVLAEKHLQEVNDKLTDTQSTLIKEEKMASIGRLAAGVAHELNNPIGFINSNFRSLKRYISQLKTLFEENEILIPEELKEQYQLDFILEDFDALLEESNEGFERIIKIINSLRSFSRIDARESYSAVDLNELVSNTLIVAGNEIKYKAAVHTDFGVIPKVPCIVGEINQVLLNLIVNSAQAVSPDKQGTLGNIHITTSSDKDFVYCSIKDDGPGINKEDILKVFDPFYTTKPIGEGTGLGLSISYDIIVNKHNGALFIVDNEEPGAEFVIKLPLGEELNGE